MLSFSDLPAHVRLQLLQSSCICPGAAYHKTSLVLLYALQTFTVCLGCQKDMLVWYVEFKNTWSSEEQYLLTIFICERKQKETMTVTNRCDSLTLRYDKPLIHLGIKLLKKSWGTLNCLISTQNWHVYFTAPWNELEIHVHYMYKWKKSASKTSPDRDITVFILLSNTHSF